MVISIEQYLLRKRAARLGGMATRSAATADPRLAWPIVTPPRGVLALRPGAPATALAVACWPDDIALPSIADLAQVYAEASLI